jgi:hypothetical protein
MTEPIVTDKDWAALGLTATEQDLPAPPSHCRCGRQLVKFYEHDGYTPTGRRSTVLTWRCPKTIGWFNRLTLTHMFHDEYEAEHFIEWHWRRRHYQ